MEPKLALILTVGLFCLIGNKAQSQNTHYFKNPETEVKLKDSADYVRIFSPPDSGSTLYNVSEYYINGKARLVGKSSNPNLLVLEGNCVSFYESGTKKEVANYKAGNIDGDVSVFYPSGQLYTVKQYTRNTSTRTIEVLIKCCMDSTGKTLAVNGTGYYIGYHSDFKDIDEEGKINAGLKDGDWKGGRYGKKGKITFTEKYKNGELIEGESVDDDNTIYHYTIREKAPEFTGGEWAFSKYLGHHVKYPKQSRDYNVQGRVFVRFVVEKDGSLTDFKVLKSPDQYLAAESVRVLSESPKWIPGTQFGRPVRVQYTVPINFSLGER